jgi:hypothetical protein
VALNRTLGSPTAPGEAVEAELNRLIERRSTRETDPDEQGELWMGSVAAYNARRREENRLAWCEYHRGQAERHRAILEALIAEHRAQAERYELGPKGG